MFRPLICQFISVNWFLTSAKVLITGQRIRFEFNVETLKMDVSQAVPLWPDIK